MSIATNALNRAAKITIKLESFSTFFSNSLSLDISRLKLDIQHDEVGKKKFYLNRVNKHEQFSFMSNKILVRWATGYAHSASGASC